ncbi:MAG: hypothetical protein Q8N15_06470, partial [Bacillota bacterium]|nr:hypothetical protein [Bacillota bacterium]
MKRLLVAVLAAVIALTAIACVSPEGLSFMVPSGSPALAQIYVQAEGYHDVDIVNGADPLIAAFGSGSHDVIFAPTNLGAKMIASGCAYVFAGAVVWGNYYLVSTGKTSFALSDLEGADIIAFGPNQTSDIVLRHILASNGITASITYVDAVATAASMFAADPSLIVLTAEPSLSAIDAVVEGVQVIDLQTAYAVLHGSASYPQAGVFLKNDLDEARVERFLADLSASVAAVNNDPAAAAAAAVALEFGFSEAVMTSAIPGSHLQFVFAAEARTALEAYFAILFAMNPALIGGALP